MTTDSSDRPTICLNMIVRDEAHIIDELVAVVAPHIDHWVIVDTGSTDGTPDVIRRRMRERGIPGELHERPWRDFGHNRTEALALAQRHCDYIWVMDADDTVEGTIDLSGLSADAYSMRFSDGTTYWRRQLFRDGVPWRYAGVLHEVAVCDVAFTEARLDGEYAIRSRRLGARNRDPLKYVRDAEVLQAEVDRNPEDRRSVFYLAQSYAWAGDLAKARHWFDRRAEMGGWDEEIYFASFRAAEVMEAAGEPWPLVQAAYLLAWSRRPSRAEPLHAIACHHRMQRQHELGHLFAERAAQIPLPREDVLFVRADIYGWRALDEQAVCGSWIGKSAETFAICERLLARDDLPDDDRRRIAANRDIAAQTIRAAAPQPASVQPPAVTPPSTGVLAAEPFRGALARRLLGRTVASGEIRMLAVPAMLDECQEICLRSFSAIGVEFSPEQASCLREALAGQLAAAHAASSRSEIVVSYDSPVGRRVNWHVKTLCSTVEAAYDAWVATRQPPYFGTAPDARVMAAAAEAGPPAACPVLDLGAGTGRNALALARRGHPVDAVEMTAKFAAILREEATRESLAIRVLERDIFATVDDLRRDYGLVVLSEVASDFRSTADLRRMFEVAAECLAPGGRLVFNVFLPRVGYTPDAAACELGQQVYTSIFTYAEVTAAGAGLPLPLVADDSVHDYEKQNLPDGAWPPTGWYANWVSGLDVFDVTRDESPIEMRWLVYRKPPGLHVVVHREARR